jgi:hypothetical protein
MNSVTRKAALSCAATALFVVAQTNMFAQSLPASNSSAGSKVTPGQFVVEPSTLIALGFEWYIQGDQARKSSVTVQYRKTGTSHWTQGMNLLRIQNEQNAYPTGLSANVGGVYTAPNMFAGSIIDLEPDTSYDVQLTMVDPDGVLGNGVRKATVKTRARPQPYAGASGHTYHVYPVGYTGDKQQPAFTGLLAAYYTCAFEDDGNKACPPRVGPGDTILVHAGNYGPDTPFHYQGADTGINTPWDGTYYLTAKGTADKPIAIVAAGDGPVVFDGGGATTAPFAGNHNLFNVMAADYNYFEGLTIQNTDIAFWAGIKDIAGATGLTVVNCNFQNIGFGVWNEYAGSSNFYIADNTFNGRGDPNYFFGWSGSPSSVAGTPTWQQIWNELPDRPTPYVAPIYSYAAIKIYGQGNVVAYNYITNFHDGFDIDTHGLPEGYPNPLAGPSLVAREKMPVANDFYNNDVNHTDDNCFETDGSMHNMRALRNRCTNDAGQATSSQPTFAGPTYFIRNVTYNCPDGSIKFAGAEGSLFYNNTFTCKLSASPGSNFQFLNNLVLGQSAGEPLISMTSFTNYSVMDFNGYRPDDSIPGMTATAFAVYTAPSSGVMADYVTTDLVKETYATLSAFSQGTGFEKHGILIDWNTFANASSPFPPYCLTTSNPPCDGLEYSTALFPSPAPGTSLDLTLKPGSVAIDAGTVIPNVTDGYVGAAPDLGAYESGAPTPHYGPRAYPVTGPEVVYQ